MEKHDANKNDERTAAVISADANRYAKCWTDAQQLKQATPGTWTATAGQLRIEHVRELFLADYRKDYAAVNAEIVRSNFNVGMSKEPKAPRIVKSALDAAINAELIKKARQKLEETRARLAFDPTADPDGKLAATFVANITTKNVEVATAVIRNYISTAKRRLFGLPVEHPAVPVIVGEQGIGKTINVDRLLSPLNDYRLQLFDLSFLRDSSCFKAFGDHYVAVLDELPRFGPTGINTLKYFITATTLKAKNYRTDEIIDFPNNVSVICTSNYSIEHKHGATRRFYEIIVDKEISQEISESIDYTKLWQGVDENGPSPILP